MWKFQTDVSKHDLVMADASVNTKRRKRRKAPSMQTSSPDNGVITINDDSELIMISAEEDSQPPDAPASPDTEEIAISDDDVAEKPTNREEIVISDDESDDCKDSDRSEDGEVIEVQNTESQDSDVKVLPEEIEQKCIEVTFSSRKLFEGYRQRFSTFLQGFKEFRCLEEDDKLILTNANFNGSLKAEQVDKKRKKHDCTKNEENFFVLDTEPSNEVTHSPIYKSKYKFLEEAAANDDDDQKKPDESASHTVSCFNCSGGHTLRDCPLPKDNRRIRIAKQKMGSKLVRYHEESDNKYNHLKPGVLSDRLKKALGVRKHEIPPHVYKMRVMGYPPGWLEEAKVFNSNLALFDSEGKKDASSKLVNSYTISPEKLVDYPGFNCKPSRDCRDEYKYFGVPPYSTALSKEKLIEFVNQKLREEAESQQAQHDPIEIKSRTPSPSLNDLELQKRQLLEQLTTNDNSNASVASTPASPAPVSSSHLDDATNSNHDLDKTLDASVASEEREMPETPTTPSVPKVGGSLPGTPIIKALSPYARLPCLDNFQKDMGPVINFENLPNATGKYEQMSGVLEKVRSTLKTRFQS